MPTHNIIFVWFYINHAMEFTVPRNEFGYVGVGVRANYKYITSSV